MVAGALLVIPMFLLGREWFSQRVSFWATLLFQCLPAAGRVLGDGLSEPLFLLCATVSLLCGTRSLRTGSLTGLALAGLTGALAYLTRPEGAVLVAAVGLVLLVLQIFRIHPGSWGRVGLGLTCLTTPALVIMVPYMLVIGHFTTKMGPSTGFKFAAVEAPVTPQAASRLGMPAQPLARWMLDDPRATNRYVWSVGAFALVLLRAFFFVLWVPALMGLWSLRDRFGRSPGLWVLALVNLAVALALFRVTLVMGYISERHLLLLLLSLSYWVVAGIDVAAGSLASWVLRRRPLLAASPWGTSQRWSLVLLLLATVIPMVKSLEALHDNRLGFRAAGYWMAQHTEPADPFYDPFGWTYYYAGRVFQEPVLGSAASPVPPRYVLLEQTRNQHLHLAGWKQAKRLIKDGHGQVVHSWDIPRGKLQLYEVSLPPGTPVPPLW